MRADRCTRALNNRPPLPIAQASERHHPRPFLSAVKISPRSFSSLDHPLTRARKTSPTRAHSPPPFKPPSTTIARLPLGPRGPPSLSEPPGNPSQSIPQDGISPSSQRGRRGWRQETTESSLTVYLQSSFFHLAIFYRGTYGHSSWQTCFLRTCVGLISGARARFTRLRSLCCCPRGWTHLVVVAFYATLT